ncbi:carbon storage regulator [Virgibacillus salexigens]|uniref:Global regulator protein family protein n=1 Tax=Virgibacillus massiliensis TaxID=1462526 RepID=A0A024QIU9_9BACI|nr:carbon storage regulator [Virgibacillus massiliensis]CDQ42120.1 Global regulator protein family protein [Virgibacillus massiliensis]
MALTLGRKPGEKVILRDSQGSEIVIEVVEKDKQLRNFTQLRINAPKEFSIIRGELDNNL